MIENPEQGTGGQGRPRGLFIRLFLFWFSMVYQEKVILGFPVTVSSHLNNRRPRWPIVKTESLWKNIPYVAVKRKWWREWLDSTWFTDLQARQPGPMDGLDDIPVTASESWCATHLFWTHCQTYITLAPTTMYKKVVSASLNSNFYVVPFVWNHGVSPLFTYAFRIGYK